MGNREDLLTGATHCLHEKGYLRTTARDIATAAGVSLAAIGYHYGSKDALMTEALLQSILDWRQEVSRALAGGDDPAHTPIERFEATCARVIDSFTAHRSLWVVLFEIVGQIDHLPEVREAIVKSQSAARIALAELFANIDPEADQATRLAIGSFYQAVLGGVMAQLIVDPQTAPSPSDLTKALRAVAANGVG